ncbi:MAG: hypothetical protein A3208_01540 [Candidatus Methanoprimaticola hominis]|nr:MAG: hypothetical protein A3208_01540 [Methanomassiliicoccales archaeon Mx-06]
MQRKHVIAAILAVAALFATFTVANVDNNEADTGETVTYHASVDNNKETALGFITNEISFYNLDNNLSVVWNYMYGSNVYTTFQTGEEIPLDVFKFTLTHKITAEDPKTDRGKYVISFTGSTEKSSVKELVLQCTITTNTGTSTQHTTSFDINFQVSLNGANTLPTTFQYSDGETTHELHETISLTAGDIVTLRPVMTNGENAADYKWYATGLPEGLSMTGPGIISGFTTKTGMYVATVVLESSSGQSKAYQVGMMVHDPELMTYYIYDGMFTEGAPTTNLPASPAQYITQQKQNVTLLIAKSTQSSAPTVTIIDGKGDTGRSTLTSYGTVTSGITTYFCYSLPTDGTGTYRVSIQKNTSEASFDLYVMPKITAIQSAIVVGSTGTR